MGADAGNWSLELSGCLYIGARFLTFGSYNWRGYRVQPEQQCAAHRSQCPVDLVVTGSLFILLYTAKPGTVGAA